MDSAQQEKAARRYRLIRTLVLAAAALTVLLIVVMSLQVSSKRKTDLTPPRTPTASDIVAGRSIMERNRCFTCHSVNGTGGRLGPALNGVTHRKSREAIVRWIESPNSIKPGTAMPQYALTAEEIEEIVTYLGSLDSTIRRQ